jgi:hypothetical protein
MIIGFRRPKISAPCPARGCAAAVVRKYQFIAQTYNGPPGRSATIVGRDVARIEASSPVRSIEKQRPGKMAQKRQPLGLHVVSSLAIGGAAGV